jgi:hypothetical protein
MELLQLVKVNKPRYQNYKLDCTVRKYILSLHTSLPVTLAVASGLTQQQAASFLPSTCMIVLKATFFNLWALLLLSVGH